MKKRIIIFLLTLLIAITTSMNCFAVVGESIIEFTPQYQTLSYMQDGTALAQMTDQNYQVIDKSNNVLYSGKNMISYKNGIYRMTQDGVVKIYDSSFKMLMSFPGIAAKTVIDGRVSITDKNLKQRLYNLSGEALLADVYDDIIYGNGDCVLLDANDNIVVYDLANQRNVIEGIEKCTSVDDNYVICIKDGKYGIVGFDGDILVDFKYSAISRELSSEYFYCLLNQTLVIYNSRFEQVGDVDISKYSSYKNLSEGLICVRDHDGNYSYVDVNGKTIIDNLSVGYNLNNCAPFYEGLAVISTANGSTYINKNGALATDRLWDGAYRFANGYALVYNNIYDETNDKTVKQWYIINNSFEVVKTLDYDVYVDPYYAASTDFSDGSIRTIDNETGLMGFVYLESYSASSNNQLKLSPTSLYQIARESQTLSEVFKDTTVKDFKNHFLNDTEMLSVIDTDGNTLNDDAYVVDGCKVQLISRSDGTTILDELTIKVSEKVTDTDPPTTDPDNPIDPNNPGTDPNKPDNDSDVTDFIDSIADKIGVTSDQLLMIAGGSLAALVLLIIVIVAIRRRRY